jgi:type IV secretory pathway TrbD component
MSPLRIVGYAGLTVLSATGLLLMVLSFGTGTWHGVVFGAGALVLAVALGLAIAAVLSERSFRTLFARA